MSSGSNMGTMQAGALGSNAANLNGSGVMPASAAMSTMGDYSTGSNAQGAGNGISTGAVGNSSLGGGIVSSNGVPMTLIQALQQSGRSSSGY